MRKFLIIFLQLSLIIQFFNFGLFFNPQQAKAATETWNFSNSSDYTLSDETKIEILGE